MTGDGAYESDRTYLTTRITADGRDGCPVEAGHYRLIIARACPWANRSPIVRRLRDLGDVFSMESPGPCTTTAVGPSTWTRAGDPVLGIERLREAYFRREPGYPSSSTVPRSSTSPPAEW